MKMMKNFTKFIEESLGFLDNMYIRAIIFALLILYAAGGVPMLTPEVSSIFNNIFAKILFILVILYVGVKDVPLAILLTLVFILSVQMDYRNQMGQMGQMGMGDMEDMGEADVAESENFVTEKEVVERMIGDKDEDHPDGYNSNDYSDCVKDCGEGKMGPECQGVGVWKDELNTQGMNCPLGFSGDKEGSPF